MTEPIAPRRGGALKILAGSVIGAILLYAATLGAIAYVAQERASQLFEAFLRRSVFGPGARGGFDRATLDVVRGRASRVF